MAQMLVHQMLIVQPQWGAGFLASEIPKYLNIITKLVVMEFRMPRIDVSQRTFERLQDLAEPFVDTPESVIVRLLLAYDVPSAVPSRCEPPPLPTSTNRRFAPDDPPPLTFTKLLSASLNGRPLAKPSWAELVRSAIELGLQRMSFDQLASATSANVVKGSRQGDGYAYIPKLGISVQGEDAKDCWTIALGLARKISVPIAVTFEWRLKTNAAHPGQSGEMSWMPRPSI